MTVAKKESIFEMAQRIVPLENVATVIDSLNTAWRRAAKGSEKTPPLSIGNFAKDRDDLTATEARFVTLWLEKRANIEPSEAAPSVSASDIQAAIQKAVELDRGKRNSEFEKRLAAELENAISQERESARKTNEENRKQRQLIHEAAMQKAIADERKAVEAEKQRLQAANEVKLEAAKEKLLQQLSGNTSQQIASEKQIASSTAKAEIAEAKAILVTEFDQKAEAKAQKAVEKAEAEWLKEKRRMEANHRADTEGWQAEKAAAEATKGFLLNDKEAAIEQWTKELEAAKAEIERLSWKRKLPSLYDVVNITSNGFALWGFIELFQAVGVLAFIISSCTFYAIVQDVKKAHRGWSAIFGIIGATAVELYYSYSHLNLFETLLKGNEYPFNISYQTIALAFTILISGGSVYAVVMTALRSRADAEEKRIKDIENA